MKRETSLMLIAAGAICMILALLFPWYQFIRRELTGIQLFTWNRKELLATFLSIPIGAVLILIATMIMRVIKNTRLISILIIFISMLVLGIVDGTLLAFRIQPELLLGFYVFHFALLIVVSSSVATYKLK